MNQIRKAFLKKKGKVTGSRQVVLMAPSAAKTVLLVSNTEDKSLKRKVEELFENASVYHLFPREIKEDRSVGFYYSVHSSDFNLTGNVKNDKLLVLLKTRVDILLDLSFGSEQLDYFVLQGNAGLKIGRMDSDKAEEYDLQLTFQNSEIKNVENIYEKLNTLTQNATIEI